MSLIRYDGKRILAEADVDREFLGKTVLLDCREFPNQSKGYLIASVDGDREHLELLYDIKMGEFGGRGLIVYGSKMRGVDMLGVYD